MSLVYHYPHPNGESPKFSLAAAIWEDGSWYASGPHDGIALIKRLRQLREFAVADYDQTTDLLRNGLERKWTQAEYMAALLISA